jgi:hypothetical protein
MDESNRTVIRAAAIVDTTLPEITSVEAQADYEVAEIAWNSSEPGDSLVQFGESKFLGRTAYSHVLETSHYLLLSGLQPDKLYYYQVVSRDEAGNTTVDDNNGELRTFKTLKPISTPWFDSMNSDEGWVVQNGEDSEGGWELGIPANSLADSAHSPDFAWGSNLQNTGQTYVESYLISPAVSLTGGNSAVLKFWHAFDFLRNAAFEQGTLMIITNAFSDPITLAVYSEATSGWEQEEIDISAYIGSKAQLVWAYVLSDFSEEGAVFPGWLLDDVSIEVNTIERGRLEVTSNLAQAQFTITGPSAGEGWGKNWSSANALAGEYTITFKPVAFYKTPAPIAETLQRDQTLRVAGTYAFDDANENGMSDEFEQFYFGEVSPQRTAGQDTDGDGFSDLSEFLAGTNPKDNTDFLAVEVQELFPDRRVALQWNSTPGRIYRIQGSSNARDWTPFSDWLRASEESTTYTTGAQPGSDSMLFQIEVSP